MTVTDEMIEAGADAICKSRKFETGQGTCAVMCMDQLGDVRAKGCAHVERIHGKLARTVIESALSASPPSDDYRRGLEDAARVIRNWSMPAVQTPSMWLIDKAGIEADILALGVSK